MSTRAILAAALVVWATLACQSDSPQPEAPAPTQDLLDPAVAEIGGTPVRLSDLDAWIKDDWFQRETDGENANALFALRSRGLKRMIDERVIAAEAARRGLERRALIEQELAAAGAIGDEEVAAFYAENETHMGGRSLEQASAQIRSFLENQRAQQVIADMRERADVTVLLERPRVDVSPDGPSLGPGDAPVTIVEFSDFQCPFCRRALPTLTELRERYPDSLRVVYRHLPLDSIHPRARAAAEASACADEQGRFWEYHDVLFDNPKALSQDDLGRYAAELEFDVGRFEACVSEGRYRAKVEADIAAAREAGITSTPAFVVDGMVLLGAQPASQFLPLIEAALERAGSAGGSAGS